MYLAIKLIKYLLKVFWQESEGDWFTSHKMSKAKIDGSLWRKALRDYERELWEGGQEVCDWLFEIQTL